MEQYHIPVGGEARLIGELIGLARGTDGSEHLISAEITQIVAACLCARGSDVLMDALRAKAIEAKRQIVPGCFTCANPCGRTSPFDLSRLSEEPEHIRQKKLMLLAAARDLAHRNHRSEEQDKLLYQALISIGIEEVDPEALNDLFVAVKQI